MINANRTKPLLVLFGLLLLVLSCGLEGRIGQRNSTPLPTFSDLAPGPVVTPTLVPGLQSNVEQAAEQAPAGNAMVETPTGEANLDSWQSLRQGLERRRISILTDGGSVQERLYLLRIDPVYYVFDVGYRPGAPQRLSDWQQETGALIVVNGGFFTAEHVATGLVIANGQASGTSYIGFGGMLAITDDGPKLRSLGQQPYDPNEPLRAGLQSFPILVYPDSQIGYAQEDGLPDRRTVIAQDRQGRILFILATTGSLTLHQMSRYLAQSDMDLEVALNLDGGASSGVQLAEPTEGIAPFSDLPMVITVRPKD